MPDTLAARDQYAHVRTHEAYCDAVAEEIDRLTAAVAEGDPRTGVLTCDEWDLARLTKHIGTVHRWVATMVREGAQTRLDTRSVDIGWPTDPARHASWLKTGGESLVAALRAADPDAPMWAWGADRHVRFWSRRMLHETGIHRCDAEQALGRTPAFDTSTAVDGIDEFLVNLPGAVYFAPGVRELTGDGETIHFHATDLPDAEWLITLEPNGFRWSHAHAKGAAAVQATAVELYLLVWGRRRYTEPEYSFFGDTALLNHWVKHSAI